MSKHRLQLYLILQHPFFLYKWSIVYLESIFIITQTIIRQIFITNISLNSS